MKLLLITAALFAATMPPTLTRDLCARLLIGIGIYYAATAGRE